MRRGLQRTLTRRGDGGADGGSLGAAIVDPLHREPLSETPHVHHYHHHSCKSTCLAKMSRLQDRDSCDADSCCEGRGRDTMLTGVPRGMV